MSELVEFLLARIAEDEEIARSAAYDDDRWRQSETNPARIRTKLSHNTVATAESEEYAEHVARWGPERVLAECEAKRRIIELHIHTTSYLPGEDRTGERCFRCESIWPCDELRALTAVYADHPDFRAEWGTS